MALAAWWKQKPIPGPDSFTRDDPGALASQATVLLGLGRQLRLQRHVHAETSGATGVYARVRGLPHQVQASFRLKEDWRSYNTDDIPIPYIPPARLSVGDPAFRKSLQRLASARTAVPTWSPATAANSASIALDLFRSPHVENAVALLLLLLASPSELVRVAAAAALAQSFHQPGLVIDNLRQGIRSEDATIRDLAAHALAQIEPENTLLQKMTAPAHATSSAQPSHTSLLVHGTFARQQAWWQPGGDFHAFFRQDLRQDLYAASDRFDWTGAYSELARNVAAEELTAWLADSAHRDGDKPTLVTHSHGGTVAFLATHLGQPIDLLVLLSMPAHSGRWMPDFNQIRRIVSIRVTNDWVIILDGGRQRFNDPRIEEHILPISFDHSATHDPEVWRQFNLAQFLVE